MAESILALNFKGYSGKILRVNLTKKKIFYKKLTDGFVKNFLGGRGFSSKIIYDMVKPRIDPLTPENLLVFAIGPLNGTFWPQSGRYVVASKSPLTGVWGESHSGGHWGNELKYAGFDAIILEGSSKDPVYLSIQDEEVEIKDARHLWGRTVEEFEKIIEEEFGFKRIPMVCIGPAGENLVRYASIITRPNGVSARAGMGAVMGSKRLKAIAIKGSSSPEVANPDEFYEFAIRAQERLKANASTRNLRNYGTAALVDIMNLIGRFPTKNFQTGVFPMADRINAETISTKYKSRNKACFNCPIGCKQYAVIDSDSFSGFDNASPEYETLSSLGAGCWNDDLKSIIYANYLCNNYGMDTISTGVSISFMMECYENGLISKESMDGVELKWGNHEAIVQAINKIAKREGFGNFLAEGVKRMAEKLGKSSEKYAMHVKGLEISGQDGRAQKSMGLAHATSNRGADHLYAYPVLDEIGFEKAIIERFGKEYLPEIGNRLSPKYKWIMVKDGEEICAIADSLVVCKIGVQAPPVFYFKDFAEALSLLTGKEWKENELRTIGERIVNLNRCFNAREGLTRIDDTLPERFLKEPAPDGPCKGHVVELDYMLEEYYKARGWNIDKGIPSKAKLKSLGLGNVAEELKAMGLYKKIR
ncbi:MAG: aldehyde ferredoxin oxidoreductase family protein [Candidatus Bathyarchaeia archaeon]